MTFARPLEGLRVLELGDDVSVAYGSRLLADLGAEVLKIEPSGSGDPCRLEPPLASDGAESALFAYLNYGKRSLALDVHTESGAALLHGLLPSFDVVICASKGKGNGPEPFDIDKLDVLARPVVVWVSPHGRVGGRSGQPSSPLVLQHAAGFAFHQASPVADPEGTPPTPCADREGALATGIVIANATLWALSSVVDREPKPWVDLSGEDVYAYLLVEPFADWAAGMTHRVRQRDPAKPTMVAGGLVWLLPCADGSIMVSPREDHQWKRWMDVMGHPQWSDDADLCGDRARRAENAPAIGREMSKWSVLQNCHAVFRQAQEQRVACFPVSTAKDMLQNKQFSHRRFYSRLKLESGGDIPAAGLPFQMLTSGGQMLKRGGEVHAPALGESNSEVLGTPA